MKDIAHQAQQTEALQWGGAKLRSLITICWARTALLGAFGETQALVT